MTKLIMGLPDRFWAKAQIRDMGHSTACLTWTGYC